jgi:hypothetical protein
MVTWRASETGWFFRWLWMSARVTAKNSATVCSI